MFLIASQLVFDVTPEEAKEVLFANNHHRKSPFPGEIPACSGMRIEDRFIIRKEVATHFAIKSLFYPMQPIVNLHHASLVTNVEQTSLVEVVDYHKYKKKPVFLAY